MVKYVVSTGPDSLTVPDVTGFDKDAARAELEKQGFVVSGFQEENTPDQDKNKVTKTDPAAQAVVAKGSKVRIFYATGNVKVPDNLVGQDWALAAVALQNAGLQPRKEAVDSDKNPDEVLVRRPGRQRRQDGHLHHRQGRQGADAPARDGHLTPTHHAGRRPRPAPGPRRRPPRSGTRHTTRALPSGRGPSSYAVSQGVVRRLRSRAG